MKRDNLCHEVKERLKRLPAPHDAHYGVVPLPPPEHAVSLEPVIHQLSQADAALGRINALATELADSWMISRILSRQEAVSSSSIEGTNSTLDELLSVEETQNEDASNAAKQVRSYARSLDIFVPEAKRQQHSIFTLELTRGLHRAVMQDDRDYQDEPGEFRSRVVWIGGSGNISTSTYNPTPPEDIAICMEDNIGYMRNEGMQSMTQNLVTRMAIAHAHFEAVHPFRDGNGRVGRLMIPLMMAAEGHTPLYLSPYIAGRKDAYYDALKMAQQRLEWHHLVGFLAEAVIATVDELFTTRQALQSLASMWKQRRRFRRNSAAEKTLGILPDYPVLTIRRLAEIFDISFPAAMTAIEQLREVGILMEKTGYARNRVFIAEEALRVINRGFGESPELPDA